MTARAYTVANDPVEYLCNLCTGRYYHRQHILDHLRIVHGIEETDDPIAEMEAEVGKSVAEWRMTIRRELAADFASDLKDLASYASMTAVTGLDDTVLSAYHRALQDVAEKFKKRLEKEGDL